MLHIILVRLSTTALYLVQPPLSAVSMEVRRDKRCEFKFSAIMSYTRTLLNRLSDERVACLILSSYT